MAAATSIAIVAVAVAACGSSSSSTSSATSDAGGGGTATSATAACVAAANNYLKPWQTLPTKLSSSYAPLPHKPASGGTVIQLVNGTIPSDGQSYQQLAVAAKAIGWTAREIIFDGTVPDLNAKFQQAVSDKPTAIVLSGWPVASIARPIAAAKKAGIVVGLSSILDQPISNPGYAALSNAGPTVAIIGTLEANWFMADSKCTGSVALFSIPFPIVAYSFKVFADVVRAKCPDCTVTTSTIQTSDIGTPAATTSMVSTLQSNPKIKYAVPAIANLASGLPTALGQAGITGVKILGSVPDATAINALQKGTNAMWVDQSSLIQGWTELNAVLWAIETGKTVTDTGGYPLAMLTHADVPPGSGIPVYPADYAAEFEKLWHVGS
jgi:ABC-type sugar transport system substrate-binding protein